MFKFSSKKLLFLVSNYLKFPVLSGFIIYLDISKIFGRSKLFRFTESNFGKNKTLSQTGFVSLFDLDFGPYQILMKIKDYCGSDGISSPFQLLNIYLLHWITFYKVNKNNGNP